jgi:hypothetical protein
MKAFIEDIFNQLRETPQREDYHPEGNVWRHTAFVMDGFIRDFSGGFEAEEVQVMIWAILFHDVGKIDCTKRHPKHGHWTSYGHASISADYVSHMPFMFPEGINRDLVRWIVKNHMKIKFIEDMSDSKVDRMKREASGFDMNAWEMLEAFTKADDMVGYMDRTTEARRERAEKDFRDFEEKILSKIENTFESRKKRGDLILVRGVPGSGKTTFSSLIDPDVRVSADDFFTDEDGNYNFDKSRLSEAHAWCQTQVFNAMRDGKERIVVDNTFTRTWEMIYYYHVASLNGYRVHSIVKENRHGGKTTHGVPDKHVEKMKDRFQTRL